MKKGEYLYRGHAVTDITYQFLRVTKYGNLVMSEAIALRVRDIISEVRERRGITILKRVMSKDHVHVFAPCPRQLSPYKIMHWIKGRASRKLQQKFEVLRRRYWSPHYWARRYFCTSSDTVTEEIVKAYIEGHTTGTAQT